MVPKIIHYIWLSNDEKPELIKNCMATWNKVMPDYTIKCWNMTNIPHNQWVDEAIKARKWAFASDYIRLYALYTEGGIYLDSDVVVKKSFDEFLNKPFFTSIEYNPKIYKDTGSNKLVKKDGTKEHPDDRIVGMTLQAAIVGSEKNNPIIKECMEYYESHHFLKEDGTPDMSFTAPNNMAAVMERYGFKYFNKEQVLDEGRIQIYDTKIFASGLQYTHPDNYAIHCYTTAWADLGLIQKLIKKLKLFVKGILIKRNA
ncbi:MAG: glycosyltransferase [Treponema sp.]|nr:glycosyltransferase [Treponema sp.]